MATTEEPKEKSFWENLLTVNNGILALIAVITGLLGLRSEWTDSDLRSKIDQLDTAKREIDIQVTKLESQIRKREFDNELKYKMYLEVKEAISKNNPQTQDVIVLIINEMLADDSAYRAKLTNILVSSANLAPSVKTDIIKTQISEKAFFSFEAPDKAITTDSAKTFFTIDVFYLEDVKSEAEPRADQVIKLLNANKNKLSYACNVRKRVLPKTVNARSGYRIDSNQIRFERNKDDESKLAQQVQKLINGSAIFPNEKMTLYGNINPTKNYISVFVRNM